MTPNRLRQIAILVDSLDTLAADRLLDQLPESLQQRVRDAVVDLDSVSDSERQTVLAEFRRGAAGGEPSKSERDEPAEPKSSAQSTYQPSWRSALPNTGSAAVERADQEPTSRASRLDQQRATSPSAPTDRVGSFSSPRYETAQSELKPLEPSRGNDLSETLAEVDVETLASVVLRESPQVLAAVLSLLPALRAAQLLELCPVELQSAALHRLHYLEELEDDVVHLLQQELRLVIRQRIKLKQKQRVGSQALAEIMVAAQQLHSSTVTRIARSQLHGEPPTVNDNRSAQRHMAAEPTGQAQTFAAPNRGERLPAAVPPMAERLTSNELEQATALAEFEPRQSFADLVDCDAASLQALLATAKPQLTLLALRGASQELLDRVLKMLPKSEAKVVQFRVQNLGPTRVQDIQQAQQYLLRLASLLEDMGRFRRPRVRARSAA